MKNIFICLLMLLCNVSRAEHVVAKDIDIDIKTNKVLHINGSFNEAMDFKFLMEMVETYKIPGDRLVIINSLGGRVDVGNNMISLMMKERATGVKYVCVVDGFAVSMGFNTLSFCDIRLATAKSRFMAHHILTMFQPFMPITMKQLEQTLDMMKKEEEPFRQQNAAALHLTIEEYDAFADVEHWWTIPELLAHSYLNGVAEIDYKR